WEKPESTYRVLVLGSSFTFGIGVDYEDTFLARIRTEFAESNPNLEILSIATPGQSIWQQQCWLEAHGRELEADLIVQIITGSGRLRHECDHDFASPPSVKDRFLYSAKATRATRIRNTVKNLGIVYFSWQALSRAELADEQTDPAFVELAPLWDLPALSPARQIDSYTQYLDDVARIVGSEPNVIFVHIPYNFVVDEAYLDRWKRSGFTAEHVSQLHKFGLELARLMEESGINFVSLIDGLVQMQQTEQVYNFTDIHFTPAGHKLLSEFLIDRIRTAVDGTASPEQD
ncbi:MAG TPA: hypothetical protein QF799_11965, partial [Gammaproteobacteria bacterium]|nr:hypothetical protein [Gammaproteobacteria bacterium]